MGEEAKVRLHAIVKGRVQGVGFRYFVRQQAQLIGALGWVRNLANGDVELTAEATQPELEELLIALRQGSPGSQVSDVQIEWGVATGELSGFAVKPTT